MSVVDRLSPERLDPAWRRGRQTLSAFGRAVFGDRLGVALFLGTVCFAGFYWRVGIFISDNVTLANTVVAMAEGHLWVEEATYGSLDSPGMHVVDGRLYGRNFGQLALSVPVLWGLRGLSTVVDAGVLLVGLWCLAFLGLCLQVGRLVDRAERFAVGGSLVAGGWFLLNLSVGRPVEPDRFPLVAMALVALLAVGLSAVVFYRLLSRMHDRRIGLTAAVVTVVATPVGFWATIPKRHAFTVAALVGVTYALYRSREATSRESLLSATGFRALAYAQVGLFAWVHSPEALVLFLTLVAVDVPTAPSNGPRSLAVVGVVFVASLVPMLVTNALVSGNPLRVPRMLPQYGGQDLVDLGSLGGQTGGSGGDGSGGASGVLSLLPPPVTRAVGELSRLSDIVLGLYLAGARNIARDPGGLYRVFVRSAAVDADVVRNQTINLTVFESAPVAAGVAAGVGAAVGSVASGTRWVTAGASDRRGRVRSEGERGSGSSLGLVRTVVTEPDPRRAVDVFVVLAAVGLTLVYVPRLPLHAQVTVRYLLPLFPLGVYAMVRQASLRRVLDRHGRLAVWTWLAGVFVGVQLLFVAVAVQGFGHGEAFQLHAVLGLSVAVPLALLAGASAVTDAVDRLIAVALGLAAALGTDFLLLSGLVYFQYGQYVLPAVESLSRVLGVT